MGVVRAAMVTMGSCIALLTASTAGVAGETSKLVASPAVEQISLGDRQDLASLPRVAAMVLLNERVTFVARARDDALGSSSSSSASTSSIGPDVAASELNPAMMLLSMLALIVYMIGRRGILRD